MNEYLKHHLIRTPLEKPANTIRNLLQSRKQRKHPELKEIYLESQRIDRILPQIISSSSNCIDIGCHLGSLLSQILQYSPSGHHMGFEPIPYKAKWLRQKFPEVKIEEIALSNQASEATFYIDTVRSGFSGLHLHNTNQQENFQKITVQCERLDNIVTFNYPINFIKLDVEGGELAVLQGSEKILSLYRPILLFECTLSGLNSFNVTSKQIFDFLTQHHYFIFLPKDFLEKQKPLSFEQFDRALQYPFQAFNFIATADRH